MSRRSIAHNNAHAAAGIVGQAAATDPFGGIGTIIAYVATRLAERQLEKIRNPTKEDDKALALDEYTVGVLDGRILHLNNLSYMMSQWRDGRFDASLQQPAPFEPSRTLAQIQEESVSLSGWLVPALPNLRAKVDNFVRAGGEKNEGEERARTLRTEYMRLAPLYQLWRRNVQEMQKLWEDDEEAMFSDQMDMTDAAQRAREDERRNTEKVLRSMGINPPQT